MILSSTLLGPPLPEFATNKPSLSAGYRSLYGRLRPLGACRTLSAVKGMTARRTFTPIFAAVNGRRGGNSTRSGTPRAMAQ